MYILYNPLYNIYTQCIYYIMYMLYIGKIADHYFQILKIIQWSGFSIQHIEQITLTITSYFKKHTGCSQPRTSNSEASLPITEKCREARYSC